MRNIILVIAFTAMCVIIGYAFWKRSNYDDVLVAKTTIEVLEDYTKRLEQDNKRFLKYVPIVERKKELILMLKARGYTHKEIAKTAWVDVSYICKALKKWWLKSSV